MLLSTFRPSLKTWLLAHTAIDSWDIALPTGNQSIGFLPPLQNLRFRELDDGVIEGIADQEVFIRKRFASGRYDALPIAALEGFYASIALRLTRQYQSINAGLRRLDMEGVSNPISVEEGGDGSFIVTLHFSLSIAFLAETELDMPLDEPFDLNSITLNIWRQKGKDFESNQRVKDFRQKHS